MRKDDDAWRSVKTQAGQRKQEPVELDRRQLLGGIGGVTAGALSGGLAGLANLGGGAGAAEAAETAPQTGVHRRNTAYRLRHEAALAEKARELPEHAVNGDEDLYPTRIGNFSKTLPHNAFGEVDPAAYTAFLGALASGDFAGMETVPKGGRTSFANPLGGLSFSLFGPDPASLSVPPPPALASPQWAAQMAELYWMALLRDVPFTEYESHPLVQQACDDLSRFSGYTGPRDATTGRVTPRTLFRSNYPGVLDGPMVSQFLLRPVRIDGILVDQKISTAAPGIDFLTHFPEWLEAQNGFPGGPPPADPRDPLPRYIRNIRDLGRTAGQDSLQYFKAAVILASIGAPMDLNNPYRTSQRQTGVATFGNTHLLELLGAVNVGTRHVWYLKWNVHRHLRPESGGARVHNCKTGARDYPIHSDLIDGSPVLDLIFEHNRQQNLRRLGIDQGSYLLPQMFRAGSPSHPSFPSAHAIAGGVSVALLKAWFLEETVFPGPLKPNADGTALVPYVAGVDGPPLTVAGELNKLCDNLTLGRDMSGVHWRSDGEAGNLLGEEVVIHLLREQKPTYLEPFTGFSLIRFNGETIVI